MANPNPTPRPRVRKDLTGRVSGKLTVLRHDAERSGYGNGAKQFWICRCECGKETSVYRSHITQNHTKSCGCQSLESLQARVIDMTGQRFGRLTAIKLNREKSGSGRGSIKYWDFQCDCGNQVTVDGSAVRSGNTKSCGCLATETRGDNNRTHGKARTPEHLCWKHVNARCTNPKSTGFENYGGRLIMMCMGFRDFQNFIALLGPKPTESHSIDRIAVDGHYSCGECEQCKENWWPKNVRWATGHQQAVNTRRRRTIEYLGRNQSIAEWAAEFGFGRCQIKDRLVAGWSIEKALTTPIPTAHKKSGADSPARDTSSGD